MESEKKRKHTETELREIFREKNFNEKFYFRFLECYNDAYKDFYEMNKNYSDDQFEENESVRNEALSYTFIYFDSFLNYIKMGHGELWAEKMAIKNYEDEIYAMYYDAYLKIKDENPELAKEEILNYCNYLKGDEYFKKYFLSLFEENEIHDEAIKVAFNYSIIYKDQINRGVTDPFAHEYAQIKASDCYTDDYCKAFALSIIEKRPIETILEEISLTVNNESDDFYISSKQVVNSSIEIMFPDGDEDDAITDYLTKQ